MFYMETYGDNSYHKYVASMTGAALKGREPDKGVYMFEEEKACDRAIGAINTLYGSGIFTIVVKREIGKKLEESKVVAKVKQVKKESPKKREQAILEKLLAREEVSAEKSRAEETEVPMADILKAVKKPTTKNIKPAKKVEVGEEIDLEAAESIMASQYELDDFGLEG